MNNPNKSSGQANKVIKGSTFVLGGTIASSVLGMLRSFIVAGGLGPSLYGAWNILMVIFTYNTYADLGLINGMNKEMPYLRGKGDSDQAEAIKDNSFWALSIVAVVVNILLVVSSMIFHDRLPNGMVIAVCILGITNILFHVHNFLISLLRTDKVFGTLGLSNILQALISLACVVLFFAVLPNKLYGALIALVVSYVLVSSYIFLKRRYRIRFIFKPALVVSTLKTGFPLIIIQIGAILLISIDRWMVAGMIDQINLGYYGIGLTLANFLFAGASTVAFTLYPYMLERFGESNEARQSERLVYTPIIVLSYLMAVACPLVALLVPLMITYALPAYILGINATAILILGIYFMSIMTIGGNFLVSIDKQNSLLIIQIIMIPLSVLLNYFLIKGGLGIKGVALGTAFVYFLYGTSVITLALLNFTTSYLDLILKIGNIYFPFFLGLLAYLLLKGVFGGETSSLKADLLSASIQVLIFCGLAVLLAWNLNRITGVISIMRGAARS